LAQVIDNEGDKMVLNIFLTRSVAALALACKTSVLFLKVLKVFQLNCSFGRGLVLTKLKVFFKSAVWIELD
jgi:hypothetical protein